MNDITIKYRIIKRSLPILKALIEKDELTLGELHTKAGMTDPGITKKLVRILVNNGIISEKEPIKYGYEKQLNTPEGMINLLSELIPAMYAKLDANYKKK